MDSVNHYLLYGRMFFPGARLEAMYARRISDKMQCLVTAVNNPRVSGLPEVINYKKGLEEEEKIVYNNQKKKRGSG